MMFRLLCACLIMLGLLAAGCAPHSGEEDGGRQVVTDSVGRQLSIPAPLTRVVVANGYNTELINALGALDAVVGVDYGIYQDQEEYKGRFVREQVIGQSQRELNYEKIIELAPQALILTGNGSWEEARRKLEPFGIQVIVLDAYYTDKFFANCALAGKMFGKEERARELAEFFRGKLDYINKQLANVPSKTVYFEYRRQGNTTVPGDYFYNMVKYAGGKNVFEDAANVSVDSESVILRNPAYIVKVGEENVSAKYLPPSAEQWRERLQKITARPGWEEIDAVQNNRILLLSHFCHGGASKLIGTMYIAKFMYPEYLPELHPEDIFKTWLTKYQNLEYIPGHTYPAFALQEDV